MNNIIGIINRPAPCALLARDLMHCDPDEVTTGSALIHHLGCELHRIKVGGGVDDATRTKPGTARGPELVHYFFAAFEFGRTAETRNEHLVDRQVASINRKSSGR